MRPNEVVHRFLASIGSPKAVEQYLQLFHAEKKQHFACLFIHPEVIRNNHNALVANLIFLQKLDLTPVLVVDDLGLVEELVTRLPAEFPIESVEVSMVAHAASQGRLPVVVAGDAPERIDTARRLASRKFIYLINQSGLQPEGKMVRSLVNMRTDLPALLAPDVLPDWQRETLLEIRELFANCTHPLSVSVTSAQDLLRELFTLRGAGTLLRRGTEMQRLHSYAEIDRKQFATLLHSAFGNAPSPSIYERDVIGIYLAADYQGAAVLESCPLAPYLSKFVVDLRAQGEGIGGDLWRAICDDHAKFFWCSRPDNAIAPWYAAQCDGMFRCPDWTVYWRGLEPKDIGEAVKLATSAPIDFAPQHHRQ